ncbi:hypothetical protein [Microbacterium resistens]|uniref:DUF2746 domain-containing protein n=1 Tax=Microbacterium resistens TaxID=156977 RepID=A0ABY3RRK3_9MICO|nr:hypothetical protein [Microbacterium resistens]UGS25900.1 hypothetical protein K8F61_14785 [Microbacterium resistens]
MQMTDPQVWTLIGVFAAAVLGGMSVMTAQFSRVLRSEGARLDAKIDGLRGEVNGQFAAMGTRLDAIDDRLIRVEDKVDDLDKEVANLATRFWRSS